MPKTQTYRNVAGLNKALRTIPKLAMARIRDASEDIAGVIAQEAASRARSLGGVAALVAPTIRSGRDRVPVVRMGSSQKLPDSGAGWERDRSGDHQTISDVMWGAEFGAIHHPQFSPWRGNDEGAGYFLWPTVRANNEHIQTRYSEALDDALQAVK